jgi:ribosomal protein L11 methyltransferase
MLPFLTLRFIVPDAAVTPLEELLQESGALSVSCTARDSTLVVDAQDGTEPPLWPVCEVEGIFAAAADTQAVLARCAEAGIDTRLAERGQLADRDWQRAWRDQFQPLCFGRRLWVVPSWHEAPRDALVITLDPGMAFGTGTHPTTAMCLDWLVRRDLSGCRVLDFGCGSGILALAAARLGARRVVAVDIDPDACEIARENAARNGCASIEVMQPEALAADEFDVVVANILLKPILLLRDTFRARLADGGALALSGLLTTQAASVLAAYAGVFALSVTETRGEWALVSGTR